MPRRIATHRPGPDAPAARSYERRPARRDDIRFYQSAPWRALRALKLSRDPLCETCLALGRITAASQVHHVIERKARPDLALDLGNLKSLCPPCHGAERRQG